jgi:hypothetical protein
LNARKSVSMMIDRLAHGWAFIRATMLNIELHHFLLC